MSETIYVSAALGVGTFVGSAGGEGSRRRWQFTVLDGSDVAVLTDDELDELVTALEDAWWHACSGPPRSEPV